MTGAWMPPAMRSHLQIESLSPVWATLRLRLERNGLLTRGSVEVTLDDLGADRVAGLLGRPVATGQVRLRLADLDAALRASAAARGLVSVVEELTGSALRDRPGERTRDATHWQGVWQSVDDDLARTGLAAADWSAPWTLWLRRSGILARLGPTASTAALHAAIGTLSDILRPGPVVERSLAELASTHTGTAHGLDDGRPLAALVLRAAAIAHDVTPAASAGDRRLLWQRLGIRTDSVSGTVLTWGLRPPGPDRWSAMMRERADLALVTHLTMRELEAVDVELVPAGETVHACENPQVLQAAAESKVPLALVCTSGNPSAAGLNLLSHISVRYHGDFDWPGIAIARRVFAGGARPWRFEAADYLAAVSVLAPQVRLPLSGPAESTPWDQHLAPVMTRTNVAVHEEALLDLLLGDLARTP